MRKNVWLLLASTVLALLLGELALRAFWSNPYADSGMDTILKLRMHHRNIDQRFDRSQIDSVDHEVAYRTNDRGYIEPALRFEHPDYTIAFLGGSTTECIAVAEEQRFPFLVSKLLEDEGLRVNTLNAARSGGTLHDSINLLFNHVVEDDPDAVILMHAANDIGLLKVGEAYRSRMGHEVTGGDVGKYMLQAASTRSALVGLLRKATTTRPFVREDTVRYDTSQIENTEPFRARLELFVALCRAFGITPVLMTQPIAGNLRNEMSPTWMDPNAQAEFNDVIRSVGQQTQAEVIDLEAYVLEHAQDLDQIFYDGIHVTDYGSTLYARHITERMRVLLDSTRQNTPPALP